MGDCASRPEPDELEARLLHRAVSLRVELQRRWRCAPETDTRAYMRDVINRLHFRRVSKHDRRVSSEMPEATHPPGILLSSKRG